MKRLRQVGRTTIALITSFVALAAAVISLAYQLWPQIKPDPREDVSAQLSVLAVEPEVTLRQWLERKRATAEERAHILGTTEPGETLKFKGQVVYVRIDVSGSKGGSVRLSAQLYNARRQKQVSLEEDPIYARSSTVHINSPRRGSVQLLFMADLSVETELQFIRVELRSEGDGLLAVADSPPILKGRIVHMSQ